MYIYIYKIKNYKLQSLCVPISLTFSLWTCNVSISGGFVLLQTHRYFVSPTFKLKPSASALSLTALKSIKQWNVLLSLPL